MLEQERVKRFQDIVGSHPDADRHSSGLPSVLIQHRLHLVAAPIAELVVHEGDGPDVVRAGWSQPDDRTVILVELPSLLVLLWKLQPFLVLETFDLLVVDRPAVHVKQLGCLAVAVLAVLLR